PRQVQRLCVPVQTDQPPRGQSLRDCFRVSARSQRCVDVRSVRLYSQPFEHLFQQHRRVRRSQSCETLDSQIFERLVVFVRVRLVLQLIQDSGMVHYFQVVQVPKDVHVSLGLRCFAQHGRNQQPSLPIQLHRLPVITSPHQKLSLCPVRARHLRQLAFNLRPNLHG